MVFRAVLLDVVRRYSVVPARLVQPDLESNYSTSIEKNKAPERGPCPGRLLTDPRRTTHLAEDELTIPTRFVSEGVYHYKTRDTDSKSIAHIIQNKKTLPKEGLLVSLPPATQSAD